MRLGFFGTLAGMSAVAIAAAVRDVPRATSEPRGKTRDADKKRRRKLAAASRRRNRS